MQRGVHCKSSQPGSVGNSSDPPLGMHWAHTVWDNGNQMVHIQA